MSTSGLHTDEALAAGKRALPRPRAPGRPSEDDQETDVWYGGYATRAMLPSFVLCGFASTLIAGVLCFFWEDIPASRSATALLAAGGALGALALFQLVRWT